MTSRYRLLFVVAPLLSLLSLAACTSPEATRVRGAGRGADPNNRTDVVRMHDGSKPYHQTPRLIEPYGHPEFEPGREAHQFSRKQRGDLR
jgi:hypothetical protein